MGPDDRTKPSAETRREEERDAQVAHGASAESTRGPQAEPPDEVDEETADHYREMTERGANQEGEGRLP
jgi:hypothetical protein